MMTSVTITSTFNCPLERAFKTPFLCDVTKVHTGFGPMPRVTHTSEDKDWGKPGCSKKGFMHKSMFFEGGEAFVDKVLERVENRYWKIEVSEFKASMLSSSRLVGEWRTTELKPNKILIEYTYTLHSHSALFYPVTWLFTKTFWRIYMKQVLENVRHLAYSNEPYLYE